MRTCGTVTTSSETAGAENVLLNPAPGLDGAVGIVRNAWQSAACDRGSAVIVEGIQYTNLNTSPPFQKNGLCCGAKVRSTDLVGHSHRMLSSAFSVNGDQIANVDWEVAVPQQLAPAALTAVREILARHNASVWEVGVFLRFTKVAASSWLANAAEGGSFRLGEHRHVRRDAGDRAGRLSRELDGVVRGALQGSGRDAGARLRRPHPPRQEQALAVPARADGRHLRHERPDFNAALSSSASPRALENGFAGDLGIVFP